MNWWWLDPDLVPPWSTEETDARSRIWLMSVIFFLLLFVPIYNLLWAFLLEFHIAAFAALFVSAPPAFYIGRRASERIWPALLTKADANAEKRRKGQSELR